MRLNTYGPVQVELLTSSVRISGFSHEIDQVRRFSDVLNLPTTVLVLNQVTFRDRDGSVLESASVAVVEKRDIVLVIPRETPEQIAQHRVLRFGITPGGQVPLPSLVVMPPFMGKGVINFRSQRDVFEGVSTLSSFFPLLDATLLMDGRFYERCPVVLVNRATVAAIASQEQQPLQSPAPAAPPGEITRLVIPEASPPTEPKSESGLTAEDIARLRSIG